MSHSRFCSCFFLFEPECMFVAADSDRIGYLVNLLFHSSIDVRVNSASLIEIVVAGLSSPDLRAQIRRTGWKESFWSCGKSFAFQSFLQFKFQQESLPRTPNDVPTRGSCKQIKTSCIVRTTREKIRVIYNSVSRRATSSIVHSLLVHDIGAIIRSHCPMNTCYWRTISSSEKKDLMDEITTNFEIDSKDSRLTNYVNRLYNGRYREFKAELSSYYKLHKTHEAALANPPIEMLDRGVDQWVELYNHFNSDKFRKSSFANIENRSKKKYNHRTGSRPLSYIVEEMVVVMSILLND
ncbi:Uncharacterized protein Fot_03337 [Forsythia ovata]|uniref:Uncharacterized protein n=1 Tax=Forsythia ovata TaxID=205694 RepID=A0ABD1X9F7_9LAMI